MKTNGNFSSLCGDTYLTKNYKKKEYVQGTSPNVDLYRESCLSHETVSSAGV